MFEKILSWPEAIDVSNWKDINPQDIFDPAQQGNIPQLENFSKVLRYIQQGLLVTEAEADYSRWSFVNSHAQLISIYADLLRRVRETAVQQPGWLQSGYWSFNGSQATFWSASYDPSISGFTLVNDGYLANEINIQKDFGKLFEIGRELELQSRLLKGGVNSIITKAAIKAIESEKETAVKVLSLKAKEITKEKISEIKTIEVTKSWSGHYDMRVTEYEAEVKNWKDSRDRWFKGLMGMLAFYVGVILVFIIQPFGWKFEGLNELNGFSKYIVGFTFYGLLAGVFLGYGFASRQLKVNQNLLEQYRHRSVVAKTIENVISVVVNSSKGDAVESSVSQEELKELVRVAALAMFEHRSIGHLSTKEGNNPLLEIINGRG